MSVFEGLAQAVRRLAKQTLPARARRAVQERRHDRMRFVEHPDGWDSAVLRSSGYADPSILERVVAATRAVAAGAGTYERDSVVFRDSSVPLAIVAGVLRSAVLDDGRVSVIDIGGSLGSSYRQCRRFLPLDVIRWDIVEQASFVEVGRRGFSSDELAFHRSLEDVPLGTTPSTFVLSSVLQYVERPHELLQSLRCRPGRHLILDRTPLSAHDMDHLCIQHAARSVYLASYPAWVLSRAGVLASLDPDWVMVSDDLGADGRHVTSGGLEFEFRSLIFERRS